MLLFNSLSYVPVYIYIIYVYIYIYELKLIWGVMHIMAQSRMPEQNQSALKVPVIGRSLGTVGPLILLKRTWTFPMSNAGEGISDINLKLCFYTFVTSYTTHLFIASSQRFSRW